MPSPAVYDLRPATVDLVVWQGDTLSVQLNVSSNGQPLDLPGAVVAATDDPSTPLTVDTTAEPGSIFVTAHGGLTPSSTRWDVQWTDPNGNVRTIAAGRVTVYRDEAR
jgi:hypothetical protein